MAWLQKRPQVVDPVNFYSAGLNKTILIVGLGNPGKDYEQTRHNAGFIALDYFVTKTDEMSEWINKKDFKCHISSGQISDTKVLAVKPTTFMNLSGQAVSAVSSIYKIPNSRIVVVHDELDIMFGQIRLRVGGSSAGHNGVESIKAWLGEDFGRIRIGIGPKTPAKIKSEDFVLKNFNEDQKSQLINMNREVTAIISEYIYGGQLPHDTRSFLV